MRLYASVLAGALTAAGAAGCGRGGPDTPDRRSGPFRPTDKIHVGQLGTLPPSQAPRPGARLVLPAPALTVPGRYPLNKLVVLRVPVRNDGTRALRIEKIDPG